MTDIRTRDAAYVWHPFTQAHTAPEKVAISKGEGAYLFDDAGNSYLDLISSWWVTLHGHAHPRIASAIAEQAQKLEQVIFTDFTHQPAVDLAEALVRHLGAPFSKVFFSDNGSTAVEIALKIAYQSFHNQGHARTRFLAFEGGYHGDTFGAMSAGVGSHFFTPFEPLCFTVDTLPYPTTHIADDDVESKEAQTLALLDAYLAEHAQNTAALIIEPLIQGAGGMRMCRAGFLDACIARCHAAGIVVIFDEVMTGFGRTGSLFACHQCFHKPDIICLSKGLTAGFLPLSVTITSQDMFNAFLSESFDMAFAHGHSFAANPLGCAAAVASLRLFFETDLLTHVAALHAIHQQWIQHFAQQGFGSAPRVTGSVAALNLKSAEQGYSAAIGKKVKKKAWEMGMLLRPLGDVLYFLPPLCITEDELQDAYQKVEYLLNSI